MNPTPANLEGERQLHMMVMAAFAGADPNSAALREAGGACIGLARETMPAALDSSRRLLNFFLSDYANKITEHGTIALDEAWHLRWLLECALRRVEKVVGLLEGAHAEVELRELERLSREREEAAS